jgi:Tfp pilus assembly protein PilZ
MEIFRSSSENRKHPRVSFKRAVKVKLVEADISCGELAQDLSEGGIRVRSNVFIPVGEQVSVGLQLKDSDKVVELIGTVKWVRINPLSESYQLGVEFADADMAYSRSRINRFISSH